MHGVGRGWSMLSNSVYAPINCMPHPYRTGIGGDNRGFDFPQNLSSQPQGQSIPSYHKHSLDISNISNFEPVREKRAQNCPIAHAKKQPTVQALGQLNALPPGRNRASTPLSSRTSPTYSPTHSLITLRYRHVQSTCWVSKASVWHKTVCWAQVLTDTTTLPLILILLLLVPPCNMLISTLCSCSAGSSERPNFMITKIMQILHFAGNFDILA